MRLKAERQLFPLDGGFHRLGGELGHIGDKGHLGRNHKFRYGIQHNPHFGAQRDPAGLLGGQEKGHVDIVQIDHIQHPPAGLHHLQRLGHPVLNAAVHGRLEIAVVDVGLDALHGGLGGLIGRLGLEHLRAGRGNGRFGCGHLRLGRTDGGSVSFHPRLVVIRFLL